MREVNSGNSKRLTVILIGIIVVLLVVGLYAFVVRPSINGFAVSAYNGGVQDAVLTIMQQAVQCKNPVPLTLGNQTINLVAIECLQQAQQSTASSK